MKTSGSNVPLFLTVSLLAATPLCGDVTTIVHSGQTLSSGTLDVSSSGVIDPTGPTHSTDVAVTVTGSSTLTNEGTIEQLNGARGVDLNTKNLTFNMTNSGTVLTDSSDAIRVNKDSAVSLTNSGLIQVQNGNGGQGLDWAAVVTKSNVFRNTSTGQVIDSGEDAIKPGVNGLIYNDGTILNTAGNEGIDAGTNSGVTIYNAYNKLATSTIVHGANTTQSNLIEGAKHAITGGNVGTNTATGVGNTPVYADTLNPNTPGIFTMSITNYANGTIQGDGGSGVNIDGFGGVGFDPNNKTRSVTFETVTVNNYGTISGNGSTSDGDGVDVDGAVILHNYAGGLITSKNSNGFSEGVTVGGGTIINDYGASIIGTTPTTGSTGVGRGITLAGVDNGANGTSIPLGSVYAYHDPVTGALVDPNITNGGLIRGTSESGIAVLGTSGGGSTVTITNLSTGKIEGNNTGLSENTVLTTGNFVGQLNGQSRNQGAIELDDTGNKYVINDAGTIMQDNTVTGTAVAMHSSSSNILNVTGGSASIIGNISGDTDADSVLNINPGAGKSFTYDYKISKFTVNINVNPDGTHGTGTVTLTGANDYSGPTNLGGGRTFVNNLSGSGTGYGSMTVDNGAILSGEGTIQPKGVNGITVLGEIAPGGTATSLDKLTFDTTNFSAPAPGSQANTLLSLNGALLAFNLGTGGTNSSIDVTGGTANTVDFTNASVSLNELFTGKLVAKYTLIQGDDTTFAGLGFGDSTADGKEITSGLDLVGFPESDGNAELFLTKNDSIVLVVTPEPATELMVVGAMALLLVLARRRALRR